MADPEVEARDQATRETMAVQLRLSEALSVVDACLRAVVLYKPPSEGE